MDRWTASVISVYVYCFVGCVWRLIHTWAKHVALLDIANQPYTEILQKKNHKNHWNCVEVSAPSDDEMFTSSGWYSPGWEKSNFDLWDQQFKLWYSPDRNGFFGDTHSEQSSSLDSRKHGRLLSQLTFDQWVSFFFFFSYFQSWEHLRTPHDLTQHHSQREAEIIEVLQSGLCSPFPVDLKLRSLCYASSGAQATRNAWSVCQFVHLPTESHCLQGIPPNTFMILGLLFPLAYIKYN